jgi:hypothetical protein
MSSPEEKHAMIATEVVKGRGRKGEQPLANLIDGIESFRAAMSARFGVPSIIET